MRPKCERCDAVIAHNAQLQKDYAVCDAERDTLNGELENKRGAMTLEIHRLMKENEELKAKYNKEVGNCSHWMSQLADTGQEITSLRESLKLAVEALEKLAGPVERNDSAIVADKALAKIKATMGEG